MASKKRVKNRRVACYIFPTRSFPPLFTRFLWQPFMPHRPERRGASDAARIILRPTLEKKLAASAPIIIDIVVKQVFGVFYSGMARGRTWIPMDRA